MYIYRKINHLMNLGVSYDIIRVVMEDPTTWRYLLRISIKTTDMLCKYIESLNIDYKTYYTDLPRMIDEFMVYCWWHIKTGRTSFVQKDGDYEMLECGRCWETIQLRNTAIHIMYSKCLFPHGANNIPKVGYKLLKYCIDNDRVTYAWIFKNIVYRLSFMPEQLGGLFSKEYVTSLAPGNLAFKMYNGLLSGHLQRLLNDYGPVYNWCVSNATDETEDDMPYFIKLTEEIHTFPDAYQQILRDHLSGM